MNTFIEFVASAVINTLILALAAFGLAIIYGLVRVINMGHGAMLTLGAYLTWQAMVYHVPFVPAVLLAAVGVSVIGVLFEHVVIRHFYDRSFDTLLLTWAFFLIATELIKIVFGSSLRNVASPLPGPVVIGSLSFPMYSSTLAIFSAVLIGGFALVFYKTTLGIRIRALTQNREVASLLGLNVSLTYKIVFGVGAFMAGLAGGLLSPLLSVGPYMGNLYLIRSFFVVLVGGMGKILGGTLVGSAIIGGSQNFFSLFSNQAIAQTAVFALAIVVLRFRPGGIMSSK